MRSYIYRMPIGALALALSVGACANMDSGSSANSQSGAQSRTVVAPAMNHLTLTQASVTSMIASWPEASRMAAADMMQKYGPPQEATASMLMWRNNGPWAWTRIDNVETEHLFPARHPDVMEQAIAYRVPAAMFDELAAYDGSVHVRRTQGWISARCDKEGANFLALNLAYDIVEGRRTVEQARTYYAAAIRTFTTTGQADPYMQRLAFQRPRGNQGDPDVAAARVG
ncbi:MAG: hypothetical protein H7124_00285 [Phycisphaerales bacterium]|nr:hypothetical protein [Hyphomonadaceae bacterium]